MGTAKVPKNAAKCGENPVQHLRCGRPHSECRWNRPQHPPRCMTCNSHFLHLQSLVCCTLDLLQRRERHHCECQSYGILCLITRVPSPPQPQDVSMMVFHPQTSSNFATPIAKESCPKQRLHNRCTQTTGQRPAGKSSRPCPPWGFSAREIPHHRAHPNRRT